MGLDLGRDLGTPRLSWRRLRVIVERLPETSALWRERNTDWVGWDVQSQLLAAVIDSLQIANWQRAGNKNSPKPKPVPRPGNKTPADGSKTYGTTAMSFAEADAWLAGDGFTVTETGNDLVI